MPAYEVRVKEAGEALSQRDERKRRKEKRRQRGSVMPQHVVGPQHVEGISYLAQPHRCPYKFV